MFCPDNAQQDPRQDQYVIYRQRLKEYQHTLKTYTELSERKEYYFQKTQPSSICTTKIIKGSAAAYNSLDEYVQKAEQLDKRLQIAKRLVTDRVWILKATEQELRKSKSLYDIIYVYRYLENRDVGWIAKMIGYSEAHIYKILRNIAM